MKSITPTSASNAATAGDVIELPAGWEDPDVHIGELDVLTPWIIDHLRRRETDIPVTEELDRRAKKFFNRCLKDKPHKALPSERYIRKKIKAAEGQERYHCNRGVLQLLADLSKYQIQVRDRAPLKLEDVLLEVLFKFGSEFTTPLAVYRQHGGLMIGNDFVEMQTLPPTVCVNVVLADADNDPKIIERFRGWIDDD